MPSGKSSPWSSQALVSKSRTSQKGSKVWRVPLGFCLLVIACFFLESLVFTQPPCVATPNYRSNATPSFKIPPELEFICDDPTLSFIHVQTSPPQSVRPTVLCIILTQESNHASRVQAIVDTWGSKCTSFIAASDANDPSLHAINVDAKKGYWQIWGKLMQTVGEVVLNGTQTYDWILKADDDTYVIMENLYSFLYNVTNSTTHTIPLVYGRRMPWPKLKLFKRELGGWFKEPHNADFGKRFFEKFSPQETLVYPHGGPGYIMNWKYATMLASAYFHSEDVVKGEVSEDLANAVTMLYRGVRPQSTFDESTGRERSHPESPRTMYGNPKWLPWIQENIQNRGFGPECCSPTSISYHHVNHRQMRLMDHHFYTCRENGKY